ncbi:serine hydrolase domain-containing protein [Lysobacter tyrosinilyticus]
MQVHGLATPRFATIAARAFASASRLLIATCLLLACPQLSAQPRLSQDQIAKIDALFAGFDREGSPGYAIGVVKNGELVYARGYGRADLENDIPITPQTSFHLASLSKQFTAAAVALLILDGKLSLDTPVATFIPEARKYGDDLRLKHLIYFTSGLTEYFSQPRRNGLPWFSFDYFTTDEAIEASLKVDRLKFAPGSRWEYANIDYMLLARIVERASGMPFSEFLGRRVFAPLGMDDSLLNDDPTTVIPHRATAYADRSNADIARALHSVGVDIHDGTGYVRLPRVSPHFGGSGVFSSVEDLAKWDADFYRHRLAGPEFTELMLRREKFQHDKDNDAFGLVHGSYKGRPMIWFSGADFDASTYMARLPEDGLTVICLSNMPTGDAEGKARQILDALLAGSAPPPAASQ